MIILLLLASAACASLAIAGHRSMVIPAQLVVATGVVIVMVVTVLPVLVVIDCA